MDKERIKKRPYARAHQKDYDLLLFAQKKKKRGSEGGRKSDFGIVRNREEEKAAWQNGTD